MLTESLVDATMEGLPTPSPPNHAGNPDYAYIKDIHQLLTEMLRRSKATLAEGRTDNLGSSF